MPRFIEVDEVVAGTPEEVAARLKGQTRFSLAAHTSKGGFWGTTPLKGRVSATGATVSLRRFDRWGRIQPVYRVSFTPHPAGTRVQGEVRIPIFLIWAMRLSILLSCAAALVMGGQLSQAMPSEAPMAWVAWLAFFAVVTIASIGSHMNHADSRLEELADTVAQIMNPSASVPIGEALATENLDEQAASSAAPEQAAHAAMPPPKKPTAS